MNKPLFSLMLCLFLSIPPVAGRTELVFGPGPEAPGSALDVIVAVVNDDVITRRELDVATAVVERQLRQRKAPVPPRSVLENQVLERLILTQLQVRAAERNGITVDDATLNAAIETLAQRNNMSLTQMRQTVERDGISFAKFRDDVRREIMGARLRQKLVDSQLQVSEQDVESLQAQLASQGGFGAGGDAGSDGGDSGGAGSVREYRIAQILVPLSEGAPSQEVAAARRKAGEVLARLREGTDFQQLANDAPSGGPALEGRDLGWRSADQLPTLFATAVPRLRPGQFSEPIRSPSGFHIVKLLEIRGSGPASARARQIRPRPPGTEQTQVTQFRARHILLTSSPRLSDEEARQRLEQLRQRIRNGEDFAALAREYSDDKASGARGGDLGWVTPGATVAQFEQEMKSLQPNEISAPFKTQFGWHIVQVLERRQGQATPATERSQAREALLRRRSDEEWELLLRRLRDEAYVEIRLQPVTAAIPTTAPATKAK